MGKKLRAPPELMVTLPELSTLSEDCQEVVQPRPKMPGVERPAIDETNARSTANDKLPGVGRDASTAEVSLVVGKSASAWATKNDQSRPASPIWACVSPRLPK